MKKTCTDSLPLKKRADTITKMNDNKNMDNAIVGSMNALTLKYQGQ